MRYTFGTDALASKRLQRLAGVFNPHSREFISKYAKYPVGVAADLGCGPGFTTQMLSMAVKAKEIYGYDLSEEFLIEATENFSGHIFVRHDLTKTPFPVSADFMFARFILCHLPRPVETLNAWADELNQGGIICVEEIEGIETDNELFARYLAVNRGLVASQGASLFAGSTLSKGRYRPDTLTNECRSLPVKDSDAAAMFYPNTIGIWEKEEYIRNSVPAGERAEISRKLRETMNSNGNNSSLTWKLRRIVLKKREHYPYLEMFI